MTDTRAGLRVAVELIDDVVGGLNSLQLERVTSILDGALAAARNSGADYEVALLATALEGYEIVPYKPSPGDDYEAHRQGAAKAIAAAYRLAAYRASQERV